MEKIGISIEGFAVDEVMGVLEERLQTTDAVVIRNSGENLQKFSVTPEMTTIIVAGLGIFGTVISSLLGYLASKKSGQIVIKSANGREIVVPGDISDERLQKIVELASELDREPVIQLRA